MKRCGQCDFIYEDDQSLCDMDGGELVFDSGALILVESATVRPAVPPAKSRRGRYAVLPLAGIFLGAILFPASYVFTRRAEPMDGGRPPAQAAQVQPPPPAHAPPLSVAGSDATALPSPAPALTENVLAAERPSRSRSARAPAEDGRPELASAPPLAKRPPKLPAPSPPRRAEKKPPPESVSHKKESKLGSILKKTGRLLKKPFKF